MSKKNEEKYFNAPIQLFSGFLEDSTACLNNVFDFAIYNHSKDFPGSETERFKEACKWYGVNPGDARESARKGKELTENTPLNSPRVGLKLSLFWQYYKDEKSEFEKVCLLGYLSIKSILQNKAFFKVDNKFWLSRMDGKAKSVLEVWELSAKLQKYASEYQTVKIKKELVNNWGLVTYSRYTRGFYVSFDITLEQLIFEAEKRRKSTLEKQYKEREKEALKAAFNKLYSNTTITRP